MKIVVHHLVLDGLADNNVVDMEYVTIKYVPVLEGMKIHLMNQCGRMKTARQKHVHLVFQAKYRHVPDMVHVTMVFVNVRMDGKEWVAMLGLVYLIVMDVVHVMNRIQNIQNVYVKKDTKVKIVDLFRVLGILS